MVNGGFLHELPGFPGIGADVRGEDQIVHGAERPLVRFFPKHIQAGAAYPSRLQGGGKGLFINQFPPGGID